MIAVMYGDGGGSDASGNVWRQAWQASRASDTSAMFASNAGFSRTAQGASDVTTDVDFGTRNACAASKTTTVASAIAASQVASP